MTAPSAEQLLQPDALSLTERRILLAALHCFTTRGYFNTRIPDIVTASGVSTGSIYHHFKDKHHLAETLVARLVDGIDATISSLLDTKEGPLERIETLIRWMLALADAHPEMVSFILYARHREFLPQMPPLCAQRPFERMRALSAEAKNAGLLPHWDDWVLSAAVFGPTLRIMQAAVDGVLPRAASDYGDELMATIHALRPPAVSNF